MTKIYINGRFLVQEITGVQRYGRQLLKAIDNYLFKNEQTDFDFICLIPKTKVSIPQYKKIKIKTIGIFHGNLWEQIDLPLFCKSNLTFSPANIAPFFSRNQVVTIHDASVFAIPDNYSFMFKLKYKLIYSRLAKTAKHVITDSKFSRDELIKYCSFNPEKISIIGLGHEHILSIEPDESILSKYNLQRYDYYLTVGSLGSHKNLKIVQEAKQLLNAKNKKNTIVVTGGEFRRVFASDDNHENYDLTYTGYVSDKELVALYRYAKALIVPSLYEGFGFPVIEGLAVGRPILCSFAASLPEVGGEAVTYFNPKDPQELADLLKVDNPRFSKTETNKQLLKFSWKNCAKEVISVLTYFANK